MMVRNNNKLTTTASKPMAPTITGWAAMALPARSICGFQNNESNMAKPAANVAQKNS
jgi:hypothetical protein